MTLRLAPALTFAALAASPAMAASDSYGGGFIGGLMARGLSGPDAARAGAWHHGAAGERLAAQREEGWSASDLPGALRRRATSRGT